MARQPAAHAATLGSLVVLSLVLCASAGPALRRSTQSAPTASTQYGPVVGIVEGGANQWRGVPFAAPPVGELRFSPTSPPQSWSTPRDATTWSAGCPQNCDLPPGTCPDHQSEDCLYLNVYAPENSKAGDNLPVYFFVPGGRYMYGAGGMELYNGAPMAAAHNVVVVVINYRLGALGFLAPNDESGNWGFQDQVAALKWVNANIRNFGGDPSQVTIGGQSAGGTSVSCLLTSPLTANLFHRAIVESDPASLRLKEKDDAQDMAADFASHAGCGTSDLSCLRDMSVEDVLRAQKATDDHFILAHPLDLFYPWTPFVGNADLPGQPLEQIMSGLWHKVPTMVGNTKNDAWMFVFGALTKKLNEIEFRAAIAYIFGVDNYDKIEELYPPGGFFSGNDTRYAMSALATDYIFKCPARAIARASSDAGLGTYLYQWDHAASFDGWGPSYSYCDGVPCHAIELPFVFNTVEGIPNARFDADEQTLSDITQAYWASWVASGTPSSSKGITWPQWQGGDDDGRALILDVGSKLTVKYGNGAEACDFWDDVGYTFG